MTLSFSSLAGDTQAGVTHQLPPALGSAHPSAATAMAMRVRCVCALYTGVLFASLPVPCCDQGECHMHIWDQVSTSTRAGTLLEKGRGLASGLANVLVGHGMARTKSGPNPAF